MNKVIKIGMLALGIFSMSSHVQASSTPASAPNRTIEQKYKLIKDRRSNYHTAAFIGAGVSIATLITLAAIDPTPKSETSAWHHYRKNIAYSAFGVGILSVGHLAETGCRRAYRFVEKVIKKAQPVAVIVVSGLILATVAGLAIKLLDSAKGTGYIPSTTVTTSTGTPQTTPTATTNITPPPIPTTQIIPPTSASVGEIPTPPPSTDSRPSLNREQSLGWFSGLSDSWARVRAND